TLTAGTNRISRGILEQLAAEILAIQANYQIVIVSSGAIAAARQSIQLAKWDSSTTTKQALSAIGQPRLMQIYSEVFADYGLRIAQCLMTYRDFNNPESRANIQNTVAELLKQGYIPIFNENDTTAVDEIV
ncbi:hypothetical protein RZS08_29365, partial [Arthrospira platensis SPKY1]|nr:hypothetical protein [Arthrospira platensis SPKY1]